MKYTNLYTHNSDIVSINGIEQLKSKINLIEATTEDDTLLENQIIDVYIKALVKHGKDANQIRQISQISKILAESLGLGSSYCTILGKAACIYDIGNIAIDNEVYAKDAKLTFEEFEVVKNHTMFGYEILIECSFPSTNLAAIISAEHHEWWNGSGYSRQLQEKNINLAARIVSLADTVGALYTKRPGRTEWKYEDIVKYVKKRNKLQFSPDVVDVFLINQKNIYEVLCTDLESTKT